MRITACAVALLVAGQGMAQTKADPELGGKVGAYIEQKCSEAAVAKDQAALDALQVEPKRWLEEREQALHKVEHNLRDAQQRLEVADTRVRVRERDRRKIEREIERAESEPPSVRDQLRNDVEQARLKEDQARKQKAEVLEEVTNIEQAVREQRGPAGIWRVVARTIELCVEKRQKELAPAVAAKPGAPAPVLPDSFQLAGVWSGTCSNGWKVNGTFTVNVTKDGAVKGHYVDSLKAVQPLTGKVGEGAKLAAGGGDPSFQVKWTGGILGAPGNRSAAGQWNGSGSGVTCGGNWTSTKATPA